MTTHTVAFAEGDLVISPLFDGIAKIVSILSTERAEIAWFYSPLEEEINRQEVDIRALTAATLYEESTVYFRSPDSGIWCRGRYGGPRPDNKHLLIIRSGDHAVVDLAEMYYPNYGQGQAMNPAHFLAARSNDAPYFYPLRERFISAWVNQRAACRSMSSLISSRVEIEPHQIAVVRRILQDPNPKYLLADEVGLGKTIEAGFVIREHVLECKLDARVLVVVPGALHGQWMQELIDRFALQDVMRGGRHHQIRLCQPDEIDDPELLDWRPTLVVIDEAHQLAALAWSHDAGDRAQYQAMAALCHQAHITLILSGTPMHGNERNFLAMLHCISPQAWQLNQQGVEKFMQRVSERERLGGIYSALTPDTPNMMLEESLNELSDLFADDARLQALIDTLRPHVDFFAPDESAERTESILALRYWIGEHYRLFHRLLRNRREDPSLICLFPGLDGLEKVTWPVSAEQVTLDEILEAYREASLRNPERYRHLNADTLADWVDALFLSPLTLSRRAKECQTIGAGSDEEFRFLEQIIEVAQHEQRAKDTALMASLTRWFETNPEGKAVIFCSAKPEAAHLSTKLAIQAPWQVVRHTPEVLLQTELLDDTWQVLICDKRGEDGLNLHGKRRLAIHYSVSRDFNRFEQRLGRFNRYCGNLHVKPVKSLVLLPEREGLTADWLALLDEGTGLFKRSVASLQFVLTEQLDAVWRDYGNQGPAVFREKISHLAGEDGFVNQERKRVLAQENLLSMEHEVIAARDFSEQLADKEEDADAQAADMLRWIRNALGFKREKYEEGGFRLCFERGQNQRQTLVDVKTFVDNCLMGLDFSEGYPPSTAMMSLSRTEASSHKLVYPLRYGQPFVETVWQLMQADPRGATMALLRVLTSLPLKQPRTYFHFQWLTEAQHDGEDSLTAQRSGDERFSPVVNQFWLDDSGNRAEPQIVVSLLDKPYDEDGNVLFQDINLREEVWTQMPDWFEPFNWKATVLAVKEQAYQQLQQSYGEQSVRHQLLAVKAIMLCTRDML
ncbi:MULTISPECIES: protein DpdE [Klebsiella]|uniref:Helicase SNF2 n=3 Tax=Klebsiella pneumoniae TaxID=573 RepID=A0A483KYQ3_KLEPN|nr:MULTISPECIES: protein DpdE [Klebsiella]HDS7552877.1 helicase SNF2 [Klebsiella pneumoniae subsp. ozaenae]EIV2283830.1 helicase SNF2 [Klebsiella pneumoniae]EIX9158168.1 helicase SNF2 [Klebsiella pneumoniae]EIX9444679.1 helicase SNF2 [Klebsiella pneumoniae]EKL1159183.1 helicase SNF2 [Klebsiella pneumoniae]